MTAFRWDSSPITAAAGLPLGQGLAFSYEAVASDGKRKAPTGILRSEDAELNQTDRRKLLSQTRDAHRNFAVLGWMIRRHLDYVSTFNFAARTPDPALNRLIERKIATWSRRENCDVAGRHSLGSIVRLLEARAILDGDCGVLKTRDGRLQPIEGDLIATPTGGGALPPSVDPAAVVHGVQIDEYGKAISYSLCKRGPASDFAPSTSQTRTFLRMVSAQHLLLHGYFDRFDQVRGISPIASALNDLIDVDEGLDYALAKLKAEQLIGLVLYREDNGAPIMPGDRTDYSKIKLGKRPFLVDLDPGDKAEFLSSSNPSGNFQSFMQLMIQLCLKALDIPYSFFSENFTNYSGSRQARLQYEAAADIKRRNLLDVLNAITEWRLSLFVEDGGLPPIADLPAAFEWVPNGSPWIDPLKEVQGDIAAISAGLATRTDTLKARGKDFGDVARRLAAENQLLADLGLPTSAQADNALIRELVNDEPQPVN